MRNRVGSSGYTGAIPSQTFQSRPGKDILGNEYMREGEGRNGF
jgi:hypothetical protein